MVWVTWEKIVKISTGNYPIYFDLILVCNATFVEKEVICKKIAIFWFLIPEME